MTQFDPVWISTDAQIMALTRAYANGSLVTKLLGTYVLEPEVSHIRGILTPWMRMPLVFVAQGRLTVDTNQCEFIPQRRRMFGWRLRGGNPGLTFRFKASEIAAVSPADFQSPVAGLFDIPFTRLRTMHAGVTQDFLLCVGGRINMPGIRLRSLELRQALEALGTASG
jgi:hypothetical protein